MANRATALLCMDRYDEALAGFQQAGRVANARHKGTGYAEEIAAIQWLLGDRAAAIATVQGAVHGIETGAVEFTDFSGGASTGLLLWYFGVSSKDEVAAMSALAFLRRIAGRSLSSNWPGPLALSVLGDIQLEHALRSKFETDNISQLLQSTETDILVRRHFTEALFYRGTMCRARADEQGCRDNMQLCAEIANPFVEVEWYLAQKEVGMKMGSLSESSTRERMITKLLRYLRIE